MQPGVAEERETGDAKDGVEDVDPVAWPVCYAPFFEVLIISRAELARSRGQGKEGVPVRRG